MFGPRDPLDDWLFVDAMLAADATGAGPFVAEMRGLAECQRRVLEMLPSLLARPRKERTVEHFYDLLRDAGAGFFRIAPAAETTVALANDLLVPAIEAGGPGTRDIQGYLIRLIAQSGFSSSIPALHHAGTFVRPHDTLRGWRAELLAAALARIFILDGTREAIDALVDVAGQAPRVGSRIVAGLYLVRALEERGEHVTGAALAHFVPLIGDERLHPYVRAQLRTLLEARGVGVARDRPEAYTLKVWLQWQPEATRTLLLSADETLEDLHDLIQTAFDWDADHLFSFFMTGSPYDRAGEYRGPSMYTEPEEMAAADVTLGHLGLTKKQRFLYLFDYGDRHEFIVEVVDVHSQRPAGDLPRIIASRGEAPAQYPQWDAEEDAGDDEQWDDEDDDEQRIT